MTVDDGSSITQNFNDVGASYGTVSFCGSRTFTIEDTSSNPVSWMSLAFSSGVSYTITAAPLSTSAELQATHNLRIKVVSDTYSSF